MMDVQFKILSEKNMQWVQLKARRKLEELKEEMEWKEYCELHDTAEEVSTSHDDLNNMYVEGYRDIGIQVEEKEQISKVSAATTSNKYNNVPDNRGKFLQSSHNFQRKAPFQTPVTGFSENLHFIKEQLESIQLNLSELGKRSVPFTQQASGYENNPFILKRKEANTSYNGFQKAFDVQRCLNADLAHFTKLKMKHESISSPKPMYKEVGFVLPYILKQKRYLARRAYLSSLSKPGITPRQLKRSVFMGKTQVSAPDKEKKKSTYSSSHPDSTRGRKKEHANSRDVTGCKTMNLAEQKKPENPNQNVVSTESQQNAVEDEVTESTVNYIINTVLNEVAEELENLDNNKVESKKSSDTEVEKIKEYPKRVICGTSQTVETNELINKSQENITYPKQVLVTLEKNHQENTVFHPSVLPMIIEKPENQQEENLTEALNSEVSTGFKATHLNQDVSDSALIEITKKEGKSENLGYTVGNEDTVAIHRNIHHHNPPPIHFTQSTNNSCTLDLNSDDHNLEVFITSESMKRISNYRKRFKKHLHQFFPEGRQVFNPWKLTNEIADALLEDCLQEIEEELYEIPSSVIADLYNEEFIQSFHS